MPPVPRASGREIGRALRRTGWTLARVEGSHHLMRGPTGRIVSIPVQGAKTLPLGTTRGVVDDLGLSVEEFVRLLKT